jgi:hypothetical protein
LNLKLFVFFTAIWAVAATVFAAIAPFQVVRRCEDYKALFGTVIILIGEAGDFPLLYAFRFHLYSGTCFYGRFDLSTVRRNQWF